MTAAEEQRSRGAEEQRSRGAEEQRSVVHGTAVELLQGGAGVQSARCSQQTKPGVPAVGPTAEQKSVKAGLLVYKQTRNTETTQRRAQTHGDGDNAAGGCAPFTRKENPGKWLLIRCSESKYEDQKNGKMSLYQRNTSNK